MNKIKPILSFIKSIIPVLLFFMFIIYYVSYNIIMAYRKNNIPLDKMVHAKAIIIDEENYLRFSNIEHAYTFSYQFKVNGKTYKGDSKNMTVFIGDTIEIIYNKDNPSINRSVVHLLLPEVPKRYKNR